MLGGVVVAALAAACDAPSGASSGAPYAATAGTRVALSVVVREEIVETGAARRLQIVTRGVHESDGAVRLEVLRAALERRDAAGAVRIVSTDAIGVGAAAGDPADAPVVKLLESLRAASLLIRLDPLLGVTEVEGLDRALDAAVLGDASLGDERIGLRPICSGEGWLESLRAAGLCEVPSESRHRGRRQRSARVRVPGAGWATMPISGFLTTATDGLSVAALLGDLEVDAALEDDGGPAPPPEIGLVRLGDVTGSATTSYLPDRGPPFKGEFTLTVPFSGGVTLRTTTTFTWTRP